MASVFSKTMQNFFGIRGRKKTGIMGRNTGVEVVPLDKSETGNTSPKVINLTPQVQKAWDWWLSETGDDAISLANRLGRYKDVDYMVYNDTVISQAVNLYADETAQSDSTSQVILVNAPNPKVSKEINRLLGLWQVDHSYICDTARNLVMYGDSIDVLDFSTEKGIEGVIPVDVSSLHDRLEFKATEVTKAMMGHGTKEVSYASKAPIVVKDIVAGLELNDTKSIAKSYKSYLLGFVIDGEYLPPWAVNHCRLVSRKSEFWPYGRPLFINLVGPFRQLKAAKTLMAITRIAKFPKEIYSVKTDPTMTEVEMWDAVTQAKQEMANTGITNKNKDEFAVGTEIWMPEGLLSHETVENNMNVDGIGDIELLRDDEIMGTGIPKGYLLPDKGSFGVSGQSLLQQSKPFGRTTFTLQSAILESLTKMIKIHFLMTGTFEQDLTEFELSMNYPIVEEASDRLRNKQDTFRFALDILDGLKRVVGIGDEDVPPSVIKKIMATYSFIDPDDLDTLVNSLVKAKKAAAMPDPETTSDGASTANMFGESKDNQVKTKHFLEKYGDRLSDEVLNIQYFESKNTLQMYEGISGKRHYYRSSANGNQAQYKQVYEMVRKQARLDKKKIEEDK